MNTASLCRFSLCLAAFASACGGDDTTAADPCAGGGTPSLAIGSGGAVGFAAYEDGDAISLVDQAGVWGLQLDLQAQGMDFGEALTTVVRTAIDGGPTEDAIGGLVFQCDAGVGHVTVFAPVPDAYQTVDAATALLGATANLHATATDPAGASGSSDVALVITE